MPSAERPALVERVQVFKFSNKLTEPFHTSLGVLDHAESIVVKLQDSEGFYGLGEGCPIWFVTGETQAIGYQAARVYAQLLVGRPASAIRGAMAALASYLRNNTAIRSAFDIALHDLCAKRAGLQLCEYLGGRPKDIPTDKTVGLGSPTAMASEAAAIVAEGYGVVKVKLGTSAVEDLARVVAIRDALGPAIPLRLDANQGWDRDTAITVLQELAYSGIEFCEQPVPAWDLSALADVRRLSRVPIMADESLFDSHDAKKLIDERACSFFNIKLAKSAGLIGAKDICAVAEASGLRCMVGCMLESRLGISAAAHLAAAYDVIAFADLDGPLSHAADNVTGGAVYSAGVLKLGDAPGHGADLSADYLATLESFEVVRSVSPDGGS